MTTLSGTVVDSEGNPVTGHLYFELSGPANVLSGACGGPKAVGPLPPAHFVLTNGQISGPGAGPYAVYGLDCLAPTGLYYTMWVITRDFGYVFPRRHVSITGASADIGGLPVVTGGPGVQYTGSLGGDVIGLIAATTVVKLQGRAIASTAPNDNDVLMWSAGAAKWTPTPVPGIAVPLPVADGGTGATSLTAGAVLLGNGTSPIVPSSVFSQIDNGGGDTSLKATFGGPYTLQEGDATYALIRAVFDSNDQADISAQSGGPNGFAAASGATAQVSALASDAGAAPLAEIRAVGGGSSFLVHCAPTGPGLVSLTNMSIEVGTGDGGPVFSAYDNGQVNVLALPADSQAGADLQGTFEIATTSPVAGVRATLLQRANNTALGAGIVASTLCNNTGTGTTFADVWAAGVNASGVQKHVGVAVAESTGASTSNVGFFLGTSDTLADLPDGDYAFYSASTRSSLLSGPLVTTAGLAVASTAVQTGNYTTTATDTVVLVDPSGGGITVELTPPGVVGWVLVVKNVGSSGNTLGVVGPSAPPAPAATEIDDSPSYAFTGAYATLRLVYRGLIQVSSGPPVFKHLWAVI